MNCGTRRRSIILAVEKLTAQYNVMHITEKHYKEVLSYQCGRINEDSV